ncbi:phage terminase large subunit family protein [Paraburkholderia sediminicola]|uniref:phage terminase large subunit family protein n=1 Tax=Paraburkholderia sediminicola TaxID=458836 RepID=UPI0038BC8FCA
MTLTSWSRRFRRLSAKASAKPGKYNPELTPWVFGMHAALDDPEIQKVVCMKSAQVAWTDGVLLNYIGKRIHLDPCAMIVMFPKLKASKKFNIEKFEPMVEVTPELAGIIPIHKGRDKNNLWDHKTFPRGFLKFVTSNAPDDVKSTPAPVVMVEEPDDANTNVKDQGDSITLLEERTKSYSDRRRKVIFGGTPTLDGFSRIQQAYQSSDQRVFLVVCPDCGERHELAWENVLWDKSAPIAHEVYGHAQPETARYVCPHCGSLWDDAKKFRAVRRAAQLPDMGWSATASSPGVAGFRIGELVSPFPGSRMELLVRKFLVAEQALRMGDDSKLRSFVNNTEGRPYKVRSGLPELEKLAERGVDYEPFIVQAGGLLIAIGVDVQHNRLAITVRAWGRGEESWLVLWDEIFGNVLEQGADPLTGGVWGALTQLLVGGYRHAGGAVLRARKISIDSGDGNTSDVVYRYVRAAVARGIPIMAAKGARDANAEIFAAPKQSVDANQENTKAAKYGLKVYQVGTGKAKDLILGNRLKLEGDGPGRMHWYRGVRADYLRQLTSEVKVPGRMGGRPMWQKKAGERNEALDTEVYALHAARSAKVHLFTEAHWLAEQARQLQPGLFETIPVISAMPETEKPPEFAGDGADGGTQAAVEGPPVTASPPPAALPSHPQVRRPPPRRIGRSSYLKGR